MMPGVLAAEPTNTSTMYTHGIKWEIYDSSFHVDRISIRGEVDRETAASLFQFFSECPWFPRLRSLFETLYSLESEIGSISRFTVLIYGLSTNNFARSSFSRVHNRSSCRNV